MRSRGGTRQDLEHGTRCIREYRGCVGNNKKGTKAPFAVPLQLDPTNSYASSTLAPRALTVWPTAGLQLPVCSFRR